MNAESDSTGRVFRAGRGSDEAACVALWVTACAERDGYAHPGVAERAAAKFADPAAWILAEDRAGELLGFALATKPGSANPGDRPGSAVLGLLAVAPAAQGTGLGRELLARTTRELENLGYTEAVLHVLEGNDAAIRLYESAGWMPVGAPFEHPLLKRPSQTYRTDLG